MEPMCSCGKTAAQHATKALLGRHHYWYFHKEIMPGCPVCDGEAAWRNDWKVQREREANRPAEP